MSPVGPAYEGAVRAWYSQAPSAADSRRNPRHFWFPIASSGKLAKRPYAFELFGEKLVLFRTSRGAPQCVQDNCPHRNVQLSLGDVCGDRIRCPYHGWEIEGSGKCAHIPSLSDQGKIAKNARVPAYAVAERYGVVWVYGGHAEEADAARIPCLDPPPVNKRWVISDQFIDYPCSAHHAVLQNLDPSHSNQLHPGVLKGEARRLMDQVELTDFSRLSEGLIEGRAVWKDEAKASRLDYLFVPPFNVITEATLPGKAQHKLIFHQLIVPTGRNTSRVFLRTINSFMFSQTLSNILQPLLTPITNRLIHGPHIAIAQSQRLLAERGASPLSLVPSDGLIIKFMALDKERRRLHPDPSVWAERFDVLHPLRRREAPTAPEGLSETCPS